MGNLFGELKRRNVVRVGIAYLVMGWIIIQVVDVVFPQLGFPGWTSTFVTILLLIGFPVALFLSWAYELTPQGVKKTEEVDLDQSITPSTGRRLDFIIITALVAALGYFVWDKFAVAPEPGEVAAVGGGASIAVLPFADMSAAGDQEYFADGISEELLNLLSKTPNLRVAARTSSFQFKGRSQDIQKIAAQLGVATVLEGSVRKSGTRLRITAQLIDAREGFHIWSQTYDRELDDIFAVQDEIAGAIVAALRGTLGLEAAFDAARTAAPTLNMEAHNAYLLGRHHFEKRTRESLALALESFRRAIELDPDYAPVWAGIGNTYLFLSERNYGTMPHEQAVKRARGALDRALKLDPDLAGAHAALGNWYSNKVDAANAIPHFERAIAINANDAQAWHWYSIALGTSARLDEAFEAIQKAAALDPLSLVINITVVDALIDRGRLDEAQEVADKMLLIDANSYWGPVAIGHIHMARGRVADAVLAYRRALALQGFAIADDLGDALADIGLVDEAYALLQGVSLEGMGDLYRGDLDAALAFARANWPSSPGDGLGHVFRGGFELIAGDPATAISYFEKARELLGPAMQVPFLMSQAEAYRRIGDQNKAQQTLAAATGRHQAAIAMGIENADITTDGARILVFERKFDEAFQTLRELLKRGRLSVWLKFDPVFAELREQPEYGQLLADYKAWGLGQQTRLKELEAAGSAPTATP